MPWCLALIFILTVGWTAFVAWTEATQVSYASVSLLVIAVVDKSEPALPLILLLSISIVSLADSLEGVIVVTKRYLDNKFVEPIRRQLRKEGEAVGEEKANRRWKAWNQRRLEAEENGVPFNELPPGSKSSNGNG